MNSKVEYMLIGSLSNNERNTEVLLIDDSLESCKEAKELLESIDESGYLNEMNNTDKIDKIIRKLSKLSVSICDDEYVPEIESLRIIETRSID